MWIAGYRRSYCFPSIFFHGPRLSRFGWMRTQRAAWSESFALVCFSRRWYCLFLRYTAFSHFIVDFTDGVLNVYVNSGGAAAGEEEAAWVPRFAAQPLGAWLSELKLDWDGAEIICDAVHTSV